MTIRLLAFALLTLLLAACATAPGTTARIDAATAAQLEKEVAAIERAFAKTMADRDHAAFASFIAEDASFRSPKGPDHRQGSNRRRLEALLRGTAGAVCLGTGRRDRAGRRPPGAVHRPGARRAGQGHVPLHVGVAQADRRPVAHRPRPGRALLAAGEVTLPSPYATLKRSEGTSRSARAGRGARAAPAGSRPRRAPSPTSPPPACAAPAERQQPAALQHVLAHRQADARLLLVAQQRQVRVEQVVRRVALARGLQAHDVAQHVGEAVAGVGAVGAALHLVVEEQPAVAAQDRDVRACCRRARSARSVEIFSRPGQSSCLSITQAGASLDDAADHARRHLHREGQRIVLQHERHVGADRLRRPARSSRRSGRRCAACWAARSSRRPRRAPSRRASARASPRSPAPRRRR